MAVQLSVHNPDETQVNHYDYGAVGQNDNDVDNPHGETYRFLPNQQQSQQSNNFVHRNIVSHDRDNRNAVYVESGNNSQYGGIYGKGNTEGDYGPAEYLSDDDDVVLKKTNSQSCIQPQPSQPNVYKPIDSRQGRSPKINATFEFPQNSHPANSNNPMNNCNKNYNSSGQAYNNGSGNVKDFEPPRIGNPSRQIPVATPTSPQSNPLPNKPTQWTIVDPIKEREELKKKQQSNVSNRPRVLPKQRSVDNCTLTSKEHEFQSTANTKQRRVSELPMPPKNPITDFPVPDLSTKQYFDNDITKETTEQLLRNNKKEGEFIFRHSSQRDGMNFSLSFYSTKVEGYVRHVNICYIPHTNQWRLGKEERPDEDRFDKVVTLCDFYIEHGIRFPGNIKVELKKPLKVTKKRASLFGRRSSNPK